MSAMISRIIAAKFIFW